MYRMHQRVAIPNHDFSLNIFMIVHVFFTIFFLNKEFQNMFQPWIYFEHILEVKDVRQMLLLLEIGCLIISAFWCVCENLI